jgi:predicted nucleic acid-binding protein
MVIIDTSIWIEAYKRRTSQAAQEIARLVEADEAAIVGITLTEVLRGARSKQEFEEMTLELLAADYIEDDVDDWILASEILLDLQHQGQVIPLPDALIAAQAIGGKHTIYSTDGHFQRVSGVQLYEPGRTRD